MEFWAFALQAFDLRLAANVDMAAVSDVAGMVLKLFGSIVDERRRRTRQGSYGDAEVEDSRWLLYKVKWLRSRAGRMLR